MVQTRNTSQKIKILEYLRSVKTHPTAETVYNAVKKDLPAISLATVYRNLNTMAKNSEILRLEINGEYRYDATICSHVHCVCKNCNAIIDVHDKTLSDDAMKNIKIKGFKPKCVHIIFRGLCAHCR